MDATTTEVPVVKTETKVSEADIDRQLVESKLPKKYGFDRRIHPLWGKYYRVNYHEYETNYIKISYFVKIIAPDKVELQWMEPLLGTKWIQKIEIR